MKKALALVLVMVMVFGLVACGGNKPSPTQTDPTQASSEPIDVNVMSYEDFLAAEINAEVTVETYVQAKQKLDEGSASFYTQAEDGAYFIYQMVCSDDEYAQLVPGTKIRVTGYKSEWAGEIEIADASFEIIDGNYIAEPIDITAVLNYNDILNTYANQYVSISCATVYPSLDANGISVPFLYSWDGSGSHDSNSDLYFNVCIGSRVYNFTVESSLCDKDSAVYTAVENLQIGDKIDLTGFLYFYNGINPHIVSVSSAAACIKSSGVMSYEQYMNAAVDEEVVVEAYVQATQAWSDNAITVYAQDGDGGYFIYNMQCTEEDAARLVPGTKIKVTGYKADWAGEIEIGDAEFEIEDGYYLAPEFEISDILHNPEALNPYKNTIVSFSDMVVTASYDGSAFLYSWDGSGSHESNSDLYFNCEHTVYTAYNDQDYSYDLGELYFSMNAFNSYLGYSFAEMLDPNSDIYQKLFDLSSVAEYVPVTSEIAALLDQVMIEWYGPEGTAYTQWLCFVGETYEYQFTVESNLCDYNSEVYATVENLQIGDVIDMCGFLYWYNGINPHIYSVILK